jgi:hypothetical protein
VTAAERATIAELLDAARADEREACAQAIEARADALGDVGAERVRDILDDLAAAIRARA